MGNSVCSLCTEPWGIAIGSFCKPVRNYSFIWYRLGGSSGSKTCWVSDLDVLWIHHSVESFKSLGTDVGSKHFAPSGEGRGCEFPPIVMLLCQGFMVRVCLSFAFPFWCRHFLICLLCRSHSANFWISFSGIALCSWRFSMSVGSCESGTSHVTIVDVNLILLFLLLRQMKSESLPEQLCNPF